MGEEQRREVIEGLNKVARELEHWAFDERLERASVEVMKARVLAGVKLLYDYENMVKALMGEFGDASDVEERC